MKPENDAYGQENLAHLLHKESFEIVERDDGFVAPSTGAPAYFSKFKGWPEAEKQAIRFAKGRVLDVGCGAGRVCLYLQQKGLEVTGIDNSTAAVEVSKRRGVKHARELPVERIRWFNPGSFDAIIMFGNNFGLFGSREKAKRLLKVMHAITSKDTVIVAESIDPYRTKDPVHLAYHKLNRGRGRMAGQLRIRIRFRQYVGKWFDYLLVSPSEMKQIVSGTGWSIGRLFKSRKGRYMWPSSRGTTPNRTYSPTRG